MVDKGDLTFGLFITGIAAGSFGLLLGTVYGIIIVAKWAWGN